MPGHVYAHLDAFKSYLVDVATNFGNSSDTDLLLTLESASRTVDGHCKRTGPDHPMSGFGPRLGTNRYDGVSGSELPLEDDLLALTGSVTVGGTSLTDESSYYKGPYDRAPYRYLAAPSRTGIWWATIRRAISVPGKWGYSDDPLSLTTLNGALDSSATSVVLTAAAVPGMTLLVDAEQMYVRSIATVTATVDRGVNGTTAATHLTLAPVSYYRYPANVTRATLVIAQRRRKSRDAGLSGEFGSGVTPTTANSERTERWLLNDYLSDYMFSLVA